MYVEAPCLFYPYFQPVSLIIAFIDTSPIFAVLLYGFRSRTKVCALQTLVAKVLWSPTIVRHMKLIMLCHIP